MAVEQKTIKLPSAGRFGGVEEVTIRNLTGADEKLIYSGVTENSIDKLLKRCIVEPANIVVADLCEQDKYYILLQIRILTFGSTYSFTTKCPECGTKVKVDMDLDDLEVFFADEELEKLMTVELSSGEKVEFKVLTSKDINEVNNMVSRLKAGNDRGTQLFLRLASVIKAVDGKEMSLIEKQKWLEEMSSRETNALWKAFSQIKLGVNMNTYMQCPVCGETSEVPVQMTAEFFRPSLDD